MVIHDYCARSPRELTVKKGEILFLLSAFNKVVVFVLFLCFLKF